MNSSDFLVLMNVVYGKDEIIETTELHTNKWLMYI